MNRFFSTRGDVTNAWVARNLGNHEMTHIVSSKQRTDHIWNLSIYVDKNIDVVNKDNIKLVIHLIYTTQYLYDLPDDDILKTYNEMLSP